MSEEKLYLYPVWLRIWHGVNALSIIVLIATGISMQYSNMEEAYINFNWAVTLHNVFGVIVTVNYLLFFIGNILSNNQKFYWLKLKGLINRLWLQAQYYIWGYFKGDTKPFPITRERKFNPLQKVTYFFTMYFFLPVLILTGLALLFPGIIGDRFLYMSGIQFTAVLHATIGFFVSLFLIIHLYVASIGKNPLGNFKSILNGYHAAE